MQSSVLNRKEKWDQLVSQLLPISETKDPLWRFSRKMRPDEPNQGWKLHISATVLNAPSVLETCSTYLKERDVLFKACATLEIVEKLNTGLFYGFSQIGKVLTIYPINSAQAVCIARDLHELTSEYVSPRVPFDLPYRKGSSVHYRYGGFRTIEVTSRNGERNSAIRDPSGKYWTDRREPGHAVPEWILNPFETFEETPDLISPLCTRFLTYEALSQRGKGGTYRSLDIFSQPVRKCIVKEGRPAGETAADGSDGVAFLLNEQRALASLYEQQVAVPSVIDSFEVDGHRYLVMEEIEGISLMQICSHRQRRLPLSIANYLGWNICKLVSAIHEAGWVWRDCKPLNLLVSEQGRVWGIDFEGATSVDKPSRVPWGTPGYTAPELKQGPVTGSNLPEDLYALGVTLYQLYTSIVPERSSQRSAGTNRKVKKQSKIRLDLDSSVRNLIYQLLAPDPHDRPSARDAASVFANINNTDQVQIDFKLYQRKRALKPKRLGEGNAA